MSVRNWFDHYFQADDSDGVTPPRDIGEAQEALFVADCGYTKKFMAWLEEQALAKLPTGSAEAVIAAAGARNAYIDVRDKLKRDFRRAADDVAAARARTT